jgi:hypothetical protein
VQASRAMLVLGTLIPAALVCAQPIADMGPQRIREAIEWGLSAPEADLEQYPMRTDRTWLVNFDTPFLRVAQFSRAMKIQNMPISEADVSPKLAGGELHLFAHARVDGAEGGVLPNIDYAVIVHPRRGETPETIFPTALQSFLRRVPSDADSGPTRIARSIKAAFPLRALAAGNEVRLTFEGGGIQTITITSDVVARVR